jgi:hypothetical protein
MIEEAIMIKFFLTIFEQILVVINTSYIIGMLWFILCEVVEDFILDADFTTEAEKYPQYFLNKFGVKTMHPWHKAVSVTYFSFTSLATVGFGDYYPVSNIERVIGAMMLLFGVACFSYIMGELINALQEHQMFYEEIDEIDKSLSQFFGILKKFNLEQPLDNKFMKNFETYFLYRRENNLNRAITGDDFIAIYNQLPNEV